eukprot:g3739.t1
MLNTFAAMKQILLVLVYCFVLVSSYSISVDVAASRKLKETTTEFNTTTISPVPTSEVTTESYSSTSSQSETNSTATASPEDGVEIVDPPRTVARPPPVECEETVPRNSNARSTNGRLRVIRARSLADCCEDCRRGTYGTCRSWWRSNRNGSRRCYLNTNR